MRIYIYLTLLYLIYALNSCSESPSIERAKADLKAQIEQESNGTISLTNVRELNSIDNEINGVKSKTIIFTATIKFHEECYIYVNQSGTGSFFTSFHTFQQQPEFYPGLGRVISFANKNDEKSFEESFTYHQTNEGWIKQPNYSFF